MAGRSKSEPFEIGRVVEVPLHDATRTRFLNYAVSVVTSRALPDVRDGLKPVQRRILYTMHHDLHLAPEKQTLKCAKVVGQVLGNYHPHGDSSVYEAMVRLAQPWTMRYPLVYGQGNFGSIDGDGPAAYRYTEAKLEPLAMEFAAELDQDTVDFVPNFDESQKEPQVLPARVPQLIINGCEGIAVGLATNIPPHNLYEVMSACCALIDNSEMSAEELLHYIKGPDFPTGGEILENNETLARIYEEGKGSIRVRGTYFLEEEPRKGPQIVIDSIPYNVKKAQLVEKIGEIVMAGKVPHMLDVRDESTDAIRIVIECSKGASPEMVMAYLYKNTSLQDSYKVNMTCITPRGPERVNMRQALLDFIDFRHEVTVRRLNHEVRLLSERIHVLEGFVKVFDALDEAIAIIRSSEGKRDASAKLQARFGLDDIQADAVLELKLYRISQQDILLVREELSEKENRRDDLLELLGSDVRLWALVRSEMDDIRRRLKDARRTRIVADSAHEVSYQAEDFIVEEEVQFVMTRDGWIRRVSKGADISKLKMRQDDAVSQVVTASTLASVIFFTSAGTAFTMRLNDVPPGGRGFGDPIQKYFKFADGEHVAATFVFDPRDTSGISSAEEGALPPLHALAVSDDGKILRFSFERFVEPSTRNGRRFSMVPDGNAIIAVEGICGRETVVIVSRHGRAILFPASEVSFLSGAGRGVIALKLDEGDRVIGMMAVDDENAGFTVMRDEGGKPIEITPKKCRLVGRGGKGMQLIKRGKLHIVSKNYLASPKALDAETEDSFSAAPEVTQELPESYNADEPEQALGTESEPEAPPSIISGQSGGESVGYEESGGEIGGFDWDDYSDDYSGEV